jgi:hypothetical protein
MPEPSTFIEAENLGLEMFARDDFEGALLMFTKV